MLITKSIPIHYRTCKLTLLSKMRTLLRSTFFAMLLLVGAQIVSAQSDTMSVATSSDPLSKVSYPVAELGGCESREACKLYCDKEANRDACFAYAQKVGLMSKGKVKAAVAVLSKKGPGNCNGKEACVAYCSDSSHQNECLSFAQTYQLISEEKMGFIKKLISGEAPGACKSAETCKMYCADPVHRDECRSFAETNGLVRTASSSPRAQIVNGVLASTTPSAAPVQPKPSAQDNLGASVWHGFLRFIGF